MYKWKRRRFTASVVTSLVVGTSGCTSWLLGSNSQNFSLSFVDVLNFSEEDWAVSLTILKNSNREFSERMSIPPNNEVTNGSWRIDKSWMEEQAKYELHLSTERGVKAHTSTEKIAGLFDGSIEDNDCMTLTFTLRPDESIGVFPDFQCR